VYEADYYTIPLLKPSEVKQEPKSDEELVEYVKTLRQEMHLAAEKLEFERAAKLRDKIFDLEKRHPHLAKSE